jgi:putative ABC transport system ATP-binding protein
MTGLNLTRRQVSRLSPGLRYNIKIKIVQWDIRIVRWDGLSRECMEPILRTENLWKTYRSGKVQVPALRGVNFEVMPGEFVAVMGPSGCGKSTLLYVIGGLAQATKGRVLVDGNDLTALSDAERTRLRRHKVGFVFQRFNLLPTLDAFGNIAIAQHIHGDGFDPHRFEVVCGLLGLTGRMRHRPGELSGGEQQRVAIARAIINEPKILLADEPTGNLDTQNSENVLTMLRRLNRELGQTIVMITHNPEAAAYAHRVVHMRDGIIVDGMPAD